MTCGNPCEQNKPSNRSNVPEEQEDQEESMNEASDPRIRRNN